MYKNFKKWTTFYFIFSKTQTKKKKVIALYYVVILLKTRKRKKNYINGVFVFLPLNVKYNWSFAILNLISMKFYSNIVSLFFFYSLGIDLYNNNKIKYNFNVQGQIK